MKTNLQKLYFKLYDVWLQLSLTPSEHTDTLGNLLDEMVELIK